MTSPKPNVTVNGREYTWPHEPTVVVCVDGSERDYIDEAIAAGVMPWTEQVLQQGSDLASPSDRKNRSRLRPCCRSQPP